MLLIARRTAVGAALLLIMPAVIWITGWKWHPGLSAGAMKLLYWITETVTQPWGLSRTLSYVPGFCGACVFVCERR